MHVAWLVGKLADIFHIKLAILCKASFGKRIEKISVFIIAITILWDNWSIKIKRLLKRLKSDQMFYF